MQSIRWIAFGVSNALSKTFAHFFPASDNVSAPYPVNCRLSVFTSTFTPGSVVLEGGRLIHPDGLRLDDAFPKLRENTSGAYGVEIELSCSQPRMDLNASSCVIEIFSQGLHSRYLPLIAGKERGSKSFQGIALRDSAQVSSLMVVNAQERPVSVQIQALSSLESVQGNNIENSLVNLGQLNVEAGAVEERSIEDNWLEETSPEECSWGRSRGRLLNFDLKGSEGESFKQANVSLFMVYRDSVSRRISSVVAL